MFLLVQTALADCMSGSLTVMPAIGTAVPARPELVVHAYGTDRDKLADLGPDDVYLRTTTGERVPVEVVALHHGDFTDDQLVVRPSKPLPKGKVELVLRGETPTLWSGGEHREVSWQVAGKDPGKPSWSAAPALVGTDLQPMGCGPSTHANVKVPVNTPWVEVELTADGGKAVRGRVEVRDGNIAIGHGMCAGIFELKTGTSYTATLTAVALGGARAEAPSTVTFVAP